MDPKYTRHPGPCLRGRPGCQLSSDLRWQLRAVSAGVENAGGLEEPGA